MGHSSWSVIQQSFPMISPVGIRNSEINIVPVVKVKASKLFKSSRGSKDRAVLLYKFVGIKTVDLQHTEVPEAYRGRGIAKHLVKAAMDFVVEEDLKAHLTCWYIQKYVKDNPQYQEHIQH